MLILSAGVYEQYDSLVYPQVMKISKTFINKMKDTGRGLVNFFLGRKAQEEDAKDLEMEIPDRETMIKQSLSFYLEPLKTSLLVEVHSEHLDSSCLRTIAALYSQHCRPCIEGRHQIKGIEMVSFGIALYFKE